MNWFAWMRRSGNENDSTRSAQLSSYGRDQLTRTLKQAAKDSAREPTWGQKLRAPLKRLTLRRNLRRMLDE